MSPVVWRWRLAWYGLRLGKRHPRVQAMQGRYAAAIRNLSPAMGGPAYVAWARATGCAGFHNRSERAKYLNPTTQSESLP